MPFRVCWTPAAKAAFVRLQADAEAAIAKGKTARQRKTSKAEGLFKQVTKCVRLLAENPRHPGLQTHEFTSIEHPSEPGGKVFEAYVQNRTPGAYRLFWCYGPDRNAITIIAITPHP